MNLAFDHIAVRKAVTELIRHTATHLPQDVVKALQTGRNRERSASSARSTLSIILKNAMLADGGNAPLCQDTGTLTFYGRVPVDLDQRKLETTIKAAVRTATRRGYLRCNTIDTVSGRSVNDNIAAGTPVFHWETVNAKRIELRLLMKGGGCENMSAQYGLPDRRLSAGRNLEGVWRCALDAVAMAQGHGCSPGILGICVGGDRATGFETAKRQFLRPLTDHASDPALAALERRILRDANSLDIGPMGLGGRTTLLAVKTAALSRLPASYFVTVAYMCWALRRGGIRFTPDGKTFDAISDPD